MTVAGTQTTAWPQLQSYALAATMVNQMVAGYQQSWLEQTGEQIVLAPSSEFGCPMDRRSRIRRVGSARSCISLLSYPALQ